LNKVGLAADQIVLKQEGSPRRPFALSISYGERIAKSFNKIEPAGTRVILYQPFELHLLRKSQLADKLPEPCKRSHFRPGAVISETVEIVENQIA
jgi:hypothetical protein